MNESLLHETTWMNLTIMPVTEAGCKSIKITGLEVYEVQEQAKVNCADRNQYGGCRRIWLKEDKMEPSGSTGNPDLSKSTELKIHAFHSLQITSQ